MTHREVVDRIMAAFPERKSETVDTFKSGDPDSRVIGIATTFIATLEVLKEAQRRGANLVVTHEPTYYNHWDKTDGMEGDAVVAAKRRFIEESGIVLWRFHDYWHRHEPDGIIAGLARRMGWERYWRAGEKYRFDIPATTLGALVAELKEKLCARSVRVVGNEGMRCSGVGLRVGAGGGEKQLDVLRQEGVDVLVCGESQEWVSCEYVRDAEQAGIKKALVVVGHCNSEEAGMEYFAEWLKPRVGDIPVIFLPAGDPFRAA